MFDYFCLIALAELIDFRKIEMWNYERAHIVKIASEEFFWPSLKKELKNQLVSEAKDAVVSHCTLKLRQWINVTPFQVDYAAFGDEEDAGPRALGIAYSSEENIAAYAALVDGNGEVDKFLRLIPPFSNRRGGCFGVEGIPKVSFFLWIGIDNY